MCKHAQLLSSRCRHVVDPPFEPHRGAEWGGFPWTNSPRAYLTTQPATPHTVILETRPVLRAHLYRENRLKVRGRCWQAGYASATFGSRLPQAASTKGHALLLGCASAAYGRIGRVGGETHPLQVGPWEPVQLGLRTEERIYIRAPDGVIIAPTTGFSSGPHPLPFCSEPRPRQLPANSNPRRRSQTAPPPEHCYPAPRLS